MNFEDVARSAELDQDKAAMREHAEIHYAYHAALVDAGFSDEQAFKLTEIVVQAHIAASFWDLSRDEGEG